MPNPTTRFRAALRAWLEPLAGMSDDELRAALVSAVGAPVTTENLAPQTARLALEARAYLAEEPVPGTVVARLSRRLLPSDAVMPGEYDGMSLHRELVLFMGEHEALAGRVAELSAENARFRIERAERQAQG